MDTLSHYLWTVAMYWQHPKRWQIGLFGALPDLLSFGILIVTNVLANGFTLHRGPPAIETIPSWVFTSYSWTHSLVICAIVLGALWLWKPWLPLLLLGWPLHILMDIPTHTSQFFPTPIFWPLSNWTYSGFSWGTLWFLVTDWVLLALMYAWLVRNVSRRSPVV